ncbi:MAG: hypothetical protein L0027_00680 [Candidatus Rokubacteria bacterium]|nr:hypothetical protein [Candidatus Rokubacteria bacterium]
MISALRFAVLLALTPVLVLPSIGHAFTLFEAAGADPASIQGAVDAFRAALGDPNNANAPGPLATGRREINWDGGGPPVIDGTAPVTPFTVFQNTRGGTFTTPGIGLTQAAATGGLLSLDLINPTYATTFAPFSPNRLFAPVGSNVTDADFSIPGTGGVTPAGIQGFGVVFSDVDLAGSTSIDFFDRSGNLLASQDVPASLGDATFSFLGLLFDPSEGQIVSARITTGSAALGPNDDPSNGVDMVVMDDFIYAEPQALVPLPGSLLLLGAGLLSAGALARARARRAAARTPIEG